MEVFLRRDLSQDEVCHLPVVWCWPSCYLPVTFILSFILLSSSSLLAENPRRETKQSSNTCLLFVFCFFCVLVQLKFKNNFHIFLGNGSFPVWGNVFAYRIRATGTFSMSRVDKVRHLDSEMAIGWKANSFIIWKFFHVILLIASCKVKKQTTTKNPYVLNHYATLPLTKAFRLLHSWGLTCLFLYSLLQD